MKISLLPQTGGADDETFLTRDCSPLNTGEPAVLAVSLSQPKVNLPPSVPLSSHGVPGVPRTLLNLCRVAVRRALGKYRLHLIPSLPLPDPIKKFLLYE